MSLHLQSLAKHGVGRERLNLVNRSTPDRKVYICLIVLTLEGCLCAKHFAQSHREAWVWVELKEGPSALDHSNALLQVQCQLNIFILNK